MTIDEIRTELTDALRAHLKPIPLVDLEVTFDLDHDGDPILRIRAVYDETGGTPRGDRLLDSVGLLRDRLRALNDDRFPILTFISSDDRQAEAA